MNHMFFTRLVFMAFAGGAPSVFADTAASDTAQLATQGAYIARAADCMACHGVKLGKEFAGGYAIDSPLGTIYSTNITPSKTYGIGNWTEKQFSRAVREGVAADGHNLYPAMPYTDYRGITDADMHALYTYFMTHVKPVDEQTAKVTSLKFPFNIRSSMKIWNLLFLQKPETTALEQDETARGRYLVDALGHCGTCHTPRNTLMASDADQYLSGGAVGGWHAPNITSDVVSGIGGWSTEELAAYLKNGHVAGKAQAAGGMAEAIEHSLRHLNDQDLIAMATYLKAVPAKRTSSQTKPAYDWGQAPASSYEFDSDESRSTLRDADRASPIGSNGLVSRTYLFEEKKPDGARIYVNACASCHQPNGRGVEDQYYPSLSKNTAVGAANSNNLVMTILKGVDRHGGDEHAFMPGYEHDLSNEQVAAVANFVLKRFGNPKTTPVTASHVALLKAGGERPFLARMGDLALPLTAASVLIGICGIALIIARRQRRIKEIQAQLFL